MKRNLHIGCNGNDLLLETIIVDSSRILKYFGFQAMDDTLNVKRSLDWLSNGCVVGLRRTIFIDDTLYIV